MYVNPNFKTKKALKEAVIAGSSVSVYQPGLGTVPRNGSIDLEGPHFPAAHTWYAEGMMRDGVLISVK